MDKPQQFLFLVQTAVLANGINMATQPDRQSEHRHEYSATGVLGLMLDAIHASERIPDDLSAHDAACDFCQFMLDSPRKMEEEASGQRMVVPYWFARG